MVLGPIGILWLEEEAKEGKRGAVTGEERKANSEGRPALLLGPRSSPAST